MLMVRFIYTAGVMTLVLWLASSGNPFGGLVVVPILAVLVRRSAESGRLNRVGKRIARAH
jgi:protein-S-isoprenylcysteine O-methyltransferase Ste14